MKDTVGRDMTTTKEQFEQVIAICRDLFAKKLKDYGASWRIMRPQSVTDQIFIKANRIRSLEIKGVSLVGEGIRPEFIGIAEKGGNIDVLVQALSGVLNSRSLDLLLVVFSNFAVASSFLGVTLGLFDYLADLFGFDDSAVGRLKTALLTFAPPVVGGLLFPNGFLYAIGYAGLAATIWAAIVPALLARASRKRFGSPKFRVWGGKPMIALILVFGVGNALVHILSSFNLLPVYQ